MIAVIFKLLNCSIILHAIVVLPDLVPVPAINKRFGIIIMLLKKNNHKVLKEGKPPPATRDPPKGGIVQDMSKLFLDIENEPPFRGAGGQ